jgi:hypothetical protein
MRDSAPAVNLINKAELIHPQLFSDPWRFETSLNKLIGWRRSDLKIFNKK